jgi:Transglutaminase-like superfamily
LRSRSANHHALRFRFAVRRFAPANLRAAGWAVRTARRTRRLLETRGLDAAIGPPPPPPLPADAERGVRGALRHLSETCLVSAIVIQAWEAAHGQHRDLIIGTTAPNDFRAHAWLAGDPVPAPDDPWIDATTLSAAADEAAGMGNVVSDRSHEGAEPSTPFVELLRRPAPDYGHPSPSLRPR